MADDERVETESMPVTEAYKPAFDTGIQQKIEPDLIEPGPPGRRRRWWHRRSDAAEKSDQPVGGRVAPDRYQYLKWWQFTAMLLAVWIPAGAIGAGLFYWWSHDASKHKTAVVFVVLAYVVVTTVAGLILAMVADRPLLSALAIAMVSAVFASVVAAAPVYGKFYCQHGQRHCAAGVLPY